MGFLALGLSSAPKTFASPQRIRRIFFWRRILCAHRIVSATWPHQQASPSLADRDKRLAQACERGHAAGAGNFATGRAFSPEALWPRKHRVAVLRCGLLVGGSALQPPSQDASGAAARRNGSEFGSPARR